MTDKELIQELRSKAEVEGAGSTRRLLELAARALERGQWVSVKDRLPEKNGEYLVFIKTGCITICWYDGQKWLDSDGCEWAESFVSHWAALPKPPEVGLDAAD